jgi:hypothetical protein
MESVEGISELLGGRERKRESWRWSVELERLWRCGVIVDDGDERRRSTERE